MLTLVFGILAGFFFASALRSRRAVRSLKELRADIGLVTEEIIEARLAEIQKFGGWFA